MSPPDPPAVNPIAAEAARWVVQLGADDPAERLRAEAGFSAWKAADPRHGRAAERLEQLVGLLQDLRTEGSHPVCQALRATLTPRPRSGHMRWAGGVLALVLTMAVPGWLVLDEVRPGWRGSDLQTTVGEWSSYLLDDGSRIVLSGDSAVNLHFDVHRRSVELLRGEILLEVAPDAGRPFVVDTAQASLRALGTRFSVGKMDGATHLVMLESRLWAQVAAQHRRNPSEMRDGRTVSAGQRLRIWADGLGEVEPVDVKGLAEAWQRHQLVVHDRPLTEVLDVLARHHRGYLHFDREALASIRVSAVLPLDNADKAMDLLMASLPRLRQRSLTRWMHIIERRPDA